MNTGSAEIKRLARIEGQVRGVARMMEEGRGCEDVLIEIRAARSALMALSRKLVETEVTNLMKAASGSVDTAEDAVVEAVRLLKYGF